MKNSFQKFFFTSALVWCVFSGCKKGNVSDAGEDTDNVIETTPAVHTAVTVNAGENCGGYYEALPSRYNSSAKKYPLILFIHGIGELGNGGADLPNILRTGLPSMIKMKTFPPSFEYGGKNYSFIVISPQFKTWPSDDQVNQVLKYAIGRYRVDTMRIYVTGLSMGGGATWELSAKYGSSLAAVVPICGASPPNDSRAQNIAGFNLPVWAFHNIDDTVVPVSYTIDYVNKINSFNPAVVARITTWPVGGHDSWTKTYDPTYREEGKNIYEWMLQFSRSTN